MIIRCLMEWLKEVNASNAPPSGGCKALNGRRRHKALRLRANDKQRQGANMNKAGFATVNPSTGEEIEAFSYFTPAQTEKVVARAHKSFQSFRELPVHKRAQLFTDLGNSLRKNKAQPREGHLNGDGKDLFRG